MMVMTLPCDVAAQRSAHVRHEAQGGSVLAVMSRACAAVHAAGLPACCMCSTCPARPPPPPKKANPTLTGCRSSLLSSRLLPSASDSFSAFSRGDWTWGGSSCAAACVDREHPEGTRGESVRQHRHNCGDLRRCSGNLEKASGRPPAPSAALACCCCCCCRCSASPFQGRPHNHTQHSPPRRTRVL